jgi:hypothetical protein
MLSKLRLATGEIARHAYRVGHFKSVHTSIVVVFTILHVIDPRAETDRQTGNKRRRVSHPAVAGARRSNLGSWSTTRSAGMRRRP